MPRTLDDDRVAYQLGQHAVALIRLQQENAELKQQLAAVRAALQALTPKPD